MSKKKKYPQKRQPKPRPLGARDLRMKEVERLLKMVQEDGLRQRESDNPYYEIPWRLLGRLLAVGMPVSADLGEFVKNLNEFRAFLPRCAAKQVIDMAFDTQGDLNRTFTVTQTLFRHSRWVTLGCPVVSLDAALVASSMLTSYPPEFLDGLTPPWDAFLIRLPSGLIEFEGIAYTDVMVHRYDSPVVSPLGDAASSEQRRIAEKIERHMAERPRERWGLYGMSGSRGYLQGESLLTEQLGLVRRQHILAPLIPDGAPSEGIMVLFARLVAGVCAFANKGALERTSPDGAPTAEYRLLSRSSQSSSEQMIIEKYISRLVTIGHAQPPFHLNLGELITRYEVERDPSAGDSPRPD